MRGFLFAVAVAQDRHDWVSRSDLQDVESIDCLHRLQNDASGGCQRQVGRLPVVTAAAAAPLAAAAAAPSPPPPADGGIILLPNAHPEQWQGCAAKCPALQSVPDACKAGSGELEVHPECFHFTCELLSCLAENAGKDVTLRHDSGASQLQVPRLRGVRRQPLQAEDEGTFVAPVAGDIAAAQRDEDHCAAVRDEVWATVAHKGYDAEVATQECEGGTFDCLLACPELHVLTEADNVAAHCAPTSTFHSQCATWLDKVNTCVSSHGVCGKTAFAHLPNTTNGKIDPANLGTLMNVSQGMTVMVRSLQEAFERTFMTPCDPACAAPAACVHGTCVQRPFPQRVTPPEGTEPTEWWDDWSYDRPNHPQLDVGRSHAYVSGRRQDRAYTREDLAAEPEVQ